MQRKLLWMLLAPCLLAISCKKSTLNEENVNTTGLKKNTLLATTAETSAAVSVNAYTNTSSYISTGFSFLNPTTIDVII